VENVREQKISEAEVPAMGEGSFLYNIWPGFSVQHNQLEQDALACRQ